MKVKENNMAEIPNKTERRETSLKKLDEGPLRGLDLEARGISSALLLRAE